MSFTKFDICTTASYLVGGEDVPSFDEDTRESRLCSRLYDTTKRQLLQMHPWVFARKQIALAQNVTAPTFDYSYSYALPSDYLRMLKVETPQNAYTIVGQNVYSDQSSLKCLYLYEPTESNLPDYFVRALEFSLAEVLAAALAQDESMVQLMNGLKKEAITSARNIDSQTKPPSHPEDAAFTLTQVR